MRAKRTIKKFERNRAAALAEPDGNQKGFFFAMSDNFNKDFEDAGVFFANYVAPWIFAALLGGLVYALGCAIDEGEERNQSVPVNKTVMVNPKQIDKKMTINYNDAKKLLANVRKSNLIKTK